MHCYLLLFQHGLKFFSCFDYPILYYALAIPRITITYLFLLYLPKENGYERSSRKRVRRLKSFGQEVICLNSMNREFFLKEKCIDPWRAIHRVIHRSADTIHPCDYLRGYCSCCEGGNLQQWQSFRVLQTFGPRRRGGEGRSSWLVDYSLRPLEEDNAALFVYDGISFAYVASGFAFPQLLYTTKLNHNLTNMLHKHHSNCGLFCSKYSSPNLTTRIIPYSPPETNPRPSLKNQIELIVPQCPLIFPTMFP